MTLTKVGIDPVIRSRIGEQTLAAISRNLWAIDCQTCGRPFGRFRTPALGVRDYGDAALVLLHHRNCLRAPWEEVAGTRPTGSRTLSWKAGAGFLPEGVLLFLVNPSCESAMIHPEGNGWRIGNLDGFEQLGLITDLSAAAFHVPPVPGLTATLQPGLLSVNLETPPGSPSFSWYCAADARFGTVASLLVGVTTQSTTARRRTGRRDG